MYNGTTPAHRSQLVLFHDSSAPLFPQSSVAPLCANATRDPQRLGPKRSVARLLRMHEMQVFQREHCVLGQKFLHLELQTRFGIEFIKPDSKHNI
jgi:hypothetical protein